jgi:hypothetical protein
VAQQAQIKGTNLLAAVKSLRTQREAALSRLPPELQHYLHERILPSAWYSEDDFQQLLHALAAIMRVPPSVDVWDYFGRVSAPEQLRGVYRAFLLPGDPAATLSTAAAHWRSFHNTGELSLMLEEPRVAMITLRRYAIVSAEMCRLNGGYFCGVALAAGAKTARAQKLACRAVSGSECVWRVSWS